MTALDPLARPLVVLALGTGEPDPWRACATRGLALALRIRLPLARVEVTPALAWGADAVVAAAGAEPAGGPAAVVVLPGEPSPATLCTAAMTFELRSRRLRLLRRLGWLPEGDIGVRVDPPGEDGEDPGGLTWVVAAGLAGERRCATPAGPRAGVGGGTVVLPAEASVDDVAALVTAARTTAGTHPILAAFAAGASDGEPPPLADAVDRAAEAASLSWVSRGRPGDQAARRVAARVGARRTLAEVEAAAGTARAAKLEARLEEVEAEIASIVHSRTWRWSREVRGALSTARRRMPGQR